MPKEAADGGGPSCVWPVNKEAIPGGSAWEGKPWEEVVDAAKAETLPNAIDILALLEDHKDEIDRLAAKLELLREALRQNIIERMEETGVKSLRNADGKMASILEPALYASMIAEKKEEALNVIRDDWNAGYALQLGIAPATLSRLVKERLEGGLPIPQDVFTYHIKKRLALRRK